MKTKCTVYAAALVVVAVSAQLLAAAEYARITSQQPASGWRHQAGLFGLHRDLPVAEAGYIETVSDVEGPGWQAVDSQVAEPGYGPQPYVEADSYGAAGGCAGAAGQCSDCGAAWCDDGCDSCGGACFAHPVLAHCTTFYGEYLYLRPRDAEIAYAVPIDGPIVGQPSNNPIQIGRVGIVDPDYQPGFRAGFTMAWDGLTSIDARYTHFESSTTDSISTDVPNVIRSLVSHPSSFSAATDFLSAGAIHDINFDLVDLSYRRLLNSGCLYCVNYVVGTRYAKLEQTFGAEFIDNETELVTSEVNFDGGGLMFGLEAERFSCSSGFHGYARAAASLLAGNFRANYFQGQNFDPLVVNTAWKADRLVPILDIEFGVGWTGPAEQLRINVGYLYSAWFNAVRTDHFIQAVQANNFLDLEDTVTFDGLAIRGEWRF